MKTRNTKKTMRNLKRRAFTLVEILAALTIGAMVLIVVLAIYSRAQSGAAAVYVKLEDNRLPREVLQRISQDLDNIAVSGQDARITIDNKFDNGYAVARMEILSTIKDAKNTQQPLEKIIWQSSIEPDTGLLALYRSHSGIALEDTLLDQQKESWQRELFVPICTGLTFLRIQVPSPSKDQNDVFLDQWSAENLPSAIVITLSFAEPYKAVDGTFDVPDDDKVVRTIAINRIRKPSFTLPPFDANLLSDINDLNDINSPASQTNPSTQEPSVEQTSTTTE
jgi:type II secretory pathway pseudopilin PulG